MQVVPLKFKLILALSNSYSVDLNAFVIAFIIRLEFSSSYICNSACNYS